MNKETNKINMKFIIIIINSCFIIISGFYYSNSTFKAILKKTNETIGLPFGCQILRDYKFPKEFKINNWKTSPKDASRNQERFFLLKSYYEKFYDKETIATPKIKNIQYILFNKYQNNSINDSLSKLTDSIIYRLPNFKGYRVYFSAQFDLFDLWKFEEIYGKHNYTMCRSTGNLIVCDSAFKNATVINIYSNMSGGYVRQDYRFFNIIDYKEIIVKDFVLWENKIVRKKNYKLSLRKNEESIEVIVN